jgi:hypothetical protein
VETGLAESDSVYNKRIVENPLSLALLGEKLLTVEQLATPAAAPRGVRHFAPRLLVLQVRCFATLNCSIFPRMSVHCRRNPVRGAGDTHNVTGGPGCPGPLGLGAQDPSKPAGVERLCDPNHMIYSLASPPNGPRAAGSSGSIVEQCSASVVRGGGRIKNLASGGANEIAYLLTNQ